MARPACRCGHDVTRIAVIGATGLIGRSLVAAIAARGDDPVPVSRRSTTVEGCATTPWDPEASPLPDAASAVDAIVNLAGEPIGPGRRTPERRRRILASRLLATRGAVDALSRGPGVLVNSSAVGYYGSTEDIVDEAAPPGAGFLASVCVEWEAAALAGGAAGRVVVVRTGVVLAANGGALPALARVARLGVLGPLGNGRQWVPWIHVADEVRAILHCLDAGGIEGPVNLVAPEAVRQGDLARRIATSVRRPSLLVAPAMLLRAVLGDGADLVLHGQHAVPGVLAATGFEFTWATLDAALADLLSAR